jgi:hypothetical protein
MVDCGEISQYYYGFHNRWNVLYLFGISVMEELCCGEHFPSATIQLVFGDAHYEPIVSCAQIQNDPVFIDVTKKMNAENSNRCENVKPTFENDSNERKRKRFILI